MPVRPRPKAKASLLNSADRTLPIDPSGPGVPVVRASSALRLLRRSTSLRTHNLIISSRRAGSLWPWSFQASSIQSTVVFPVSRVPPPIATLSFMSVVSATLQPSPTSPMRSASDTRASVR